MGAKRSPRNARVLGCGRSGTSIFGELFEQLNAYSYVSEPPFIEMLRATQDCFLPPEVL